jgi:ApaG protein
MSQEEQISTAVTEGIQVVVRSRYLPSESVPAAARYVFSYTVHIRNKGQQAAQLRNRHWTITDGTGKSDEVKGAGVVGEQPLLRPGEEFEYTSGVVLRVPSGSMCGSYEMHRPNGRVFDALVAPFALTQPYSLN